MTVQQEKDIWYVYKDSSMKKQIVHVTHLEFSVVKYPQVRKLDDNVQQGHNHAILTAKLL